VKDELELRSRFAALRSEDAARTPSFEQVLRRARPKDDIRLRALAATVCVVAIAVTGIVLHVTAKRAPRVLEAASLAHWRAPTDFLLYTPGRELLHSVPSIGEPLPVVLRRFPSLDITPFHPVGQEPHS
jgi:hypothetical protein